MTTAPVREDDFSLDSLLHSLQLARHMLPVNAHPIHRKRLALIELLLRRAWAEFVPTAPGDPADKVDTAAFIAEVDRTLDAYHAGIAAADAIRQARLDAEALAP